MSFSLPRLRPWLLLTCLINIAAGPATAPSSKTPPGAHQLQSASRNVDEILDRAHRRDPATLLKLAQQTTSSPSLRYVATLRAMELAADAGNVPLALQSLSILLDEYDLDRYELRIKVAQRLLKSPSPSAAAILSLRWLDDCYADGRLDAADRFADILSAGEKSLAQPLLTTAREAQEDHRSALRIGRQSTTRPSTNPAKPLAAPSPLFACLYQDAWDQYLPALAASTAPLSATARVDLSAHDHASRLNVANTWWAAGTETTGRTGWRIQRRATMIYARELPHTDGVERELLLGRLAEHSAAAIARQGYLPGVFRTVRRDASPISPPGSVTTIGLAKDDASLDVPRAQGHVAWEGLILITAPGEHTFHLTGGTELSLAIDGRTILDDPLAYRKRSGISCNIDLTSGLHRIRVEVASASSRPRLSLEWTTPASTEKCPIPASQLFHDPLTPPARRSE